MGFTAQLASPFPLTVKCTATVEGDTLTGTAKAPMTSVAFTGTRAAAA